jgi:DNA-binding response OmpR family regulator
MQIALFTQDKAVQALVAKVTGMAAHACLSFVQPKAVQDYLQNEACDALIMDSTSSRDNAMLLSWVRSHLAPSFPVIALLPVEFEVAAEAVNQGVTDYLVKPIRQAELALRLRVMLQRAYPERFTSAPLVFGDYTFDEAGHALLFQDKPVDLTHKEFALALLFFRHLNRPLSRAFIVERIWSRELEVSSRTIDTHVSRVRNKLGLKPENGFKLAPVYSFGYRLEEVGAQTSISNEARS